MALAHGEVVGIVGGSHLYRAGAEVAADPLIENDGNLSANKRQAEFLAVQMEIAFVFRMNGNGYIAEHGFGARGRNREKLAGIFTIGADYRGPRGQVFVRGVAYGIANLP